MPRTGVPNGGHSDTGHEHSRFRDSPCKRDNGQTGTVQEWFVTTECPCRRAAATQMADASMLYMHMHTTPLRKATMQPIDVNGAYRGSHSTTRRARRHGQEVTTFRKANGGRAFPRTTNLEVTTDCLIRYADGTFGRIAKDYVKPRARKTDAVANEPTKVTRAMPVTVTVARTSSFDAAHAESYV